MLLAPAAQDLFGGGGADPAPGGQRLAAERTHRLGDLPAVLAGPAGVVGPQVQLPQGRQALLFGGFVEERQVREPVQHGLIDHDGVEGVVPGAVEVQVRLQSQLRHGLLQGGLTAQVPAVELLVHVLQVEILALPARVEGDAVKLEVPQQHLHVVVAPLHEHRVLPAPVEEGGAQVQEGGGVGQQLPQLLPAVGQQAVGAVVDLPAHLGVDVAVEGVLHGAGLLVHLHGGHLQQLMEGLALPVLPPVKRGIPFQIQKNQLGHSLRLPYV